MTVVEMHDLWSQTSIGILSPPLAICDPWASYLNLSEPLFPQFKNRYNRRSYIIRFKFILILYLKL